MRALDPALVVILVCAACGGGGPPAATAVPHNEPVAVPGSTDAGPLLGAEVIEIKDVWIGLGCTHDFAARLTAQGDRFEGEAELTVGWKDDRAAKKVVAVPRAVVAALQSEAEAARTQMANADPGDEGESHWTDDYPSGSMTFTGPAGIHRLVFTDQQRQLQWEHDGVTTPLDHPQDLSEHGSKIWEAYTAVLGAAGLRAWIDEACDRK
ncbi:MAG: hypothetical protein IPL61_27100 [Myxococcales bacterium]|nr:hypothetical protein [Myxococcales bacterium]